MPGCSKGSYRKKTIDVASLTPNAWGLCDMHGNVWECCQEWFGDYPARLQILEGLRVAPSGFTAAVAGAAALAAAVQRFVATFRRATATSVWAFASPGHLNFWFFTFLPFEKSGGVHKMCAKRSRV